MIAFQRANPRYGEVGFSGDNMKVGVDGSSVRTTEPKKGPELVLLPECLKDLLHNVLLKKAKTDTLAKVKKVFMVDPACQTIVKERRPALAKEFKKIAFDGVEGGTEIRDGARPADGGLHGAHRAQGRARQADAQRQGRRRADDPLQPLRGSTARAPS